MSDPLIIPLMSLYGPMMLIAERPWLAVIPAGLLGLLMLSTKRRQGQWRTLAIAALLWSALLFAGSGWAEKVSGFIIMAALYGVTSVGLWRAAPSFGRPIAALARGVGMLMFASILTSAAAWGLVYYREEAYPWTDYSRPHATLHVRNEADETVYVSWRWANDTYGTEFQPWSGQESGFDYLYPAFKPQPPGPVSLEDVWPAPDVPKPLMLLVQRSKDLGGGNFERRVEVMLDSHVQIRVNESGAVFVAEGPESWIGSPDLGPEICLTP